MKNFSPTPKVLSAATYGAPEVFAQNGLDPHTAFRRVGLDLDAISGPVTELCLRQYCELFEAASQLSGNEHIGLQFGRNFLPNHLGMLGFAATSSPTLGAALWNMEKYFPAHQEQTSFRLVRNDDILWLSYKILDKRIENRDQDAEISLCMFVNIIKAATGNDWKPVEIHFEHERHGDSREHEKVFDAPILFKRKTNAIGLRKEDLEAIMPTQDPYLFTLVESFLANRVSNCESHAEFADVVKNEIKLHLGVKLPTLRDISQTFGTSSGKLQRLLRNHGLTFPDLLRAARKDLAILYLQSEEMSLLEIAFSLGYSELSAFSRAFKNWTGISPHRYRQQQLNASDNWQNFR